ncbi:MAG: phosphate ABC transporter permease PstA [Bacteroidota bacterium]|nr:phosphate ABC transporter permease PstA [Bacteroidota bacterium]
MKSITEIDNIGSRTKKDRIFLGLVVLLSVVTVSPIVLIIFKLITKGYKQLNFGFLVEKMPDTMQAMTAVANNELIPGGIANAILGTLLMVALASVIAIPVGIISGVYLYENQGKWMANLTRSVSDILQGVPSIVLGLISYLWVVKHITNGFSALAGSFALGIMMLPMIVRSTEETLKMIPQTLKEAGLALGIPYWRVLFGILIPTGFSGLMTGILLAVSRVIGETAPLMLTALGSSVINTNISKPTSAIPLVIWEFYNDPNMVDLIWSSSLLLMIMVLAFNLTAKQVAASRK